MTFKSELKLTENESRVYKKTATFLPSVTLPEICACIRGHKSLGEKNFYKKYLEPKFKQLGLSFTKDFFGNYYVRIKGEQMNRVLHVGHLDTVSGAQNVNLYQKVKVDSDNFMTLDYDFYKGKKGGNPSCLGADDGVAISTMLYLMAHGISGTYLFTRGEEVGCLGAKHIIDNHPEFLEQFEIALEVDRAGTTELIAEQSTGLCSSKKFIDTLAAGLGMRHESSDRGVITDVGYFNEFIKECVNIAAGYENQHGDQEVVDITYCDMLAKQMVLLDYSSLLVDRLVTDMGYQETWGNYGGGYLGGSISSYAEDYYASNTGKSRKKTKAAKKVPTRMLAMDPALETGLDLIDVPAEHLADLYDNPAHSDWFWRLNAEARQELLKWEYPLITGVSSAELDFLELNDWVIENAELVTDYLQENNIDLAELKAGDLIPSIEDIYNGGEV